MIVVELLGGVYTWIKASLCLHSSVVFQRHISRIDVEKYLKRYDFLIFYFKIATHNSQLATRNSYLYMLPRTKIGFEVKKNIFYLVSKVLSKIDRT